MPDTTFSGSEQAVEMLALDATEREHELAFPVERRRKLGVFFWVCTAWLAITILAAIFAPLLHLQNPDTAPFLNVYQGPSLAHWFGLDDQGRDIFSRVVYGARVSVEVGFGSMAIGFFIGGTLGMMAAYRRGVIDFVLTTLMNGILVFPGLIVTLALLSFWLPRELWKIIVVIGVTSVPIIYRAVRAAALSVGTRDFVLAARVQGASTRRIIFKEILPNIAPIALSFLLYGVAAVVVIEGSLSFLNLSVAPPTPSWGNMINESLGRLPESTWLVLFPSLAMILFLLSLNFIGDRLRSYFDVTESRL